ncbi:MAG: bifunctional UDP-3-O-[3-hydroxymyristoyl] N-acetylglucosamine deacetylase/3-hydroxyacyl-ACP dehydratase [Endomicrobiia bacterium]|nr:bifunctional UDP-3-O-[3-hydroxymyristoyl] N-acetylglucosamine deacetylase/3-hydroxyacyl-ACP dehydratase [Endomicrobiaceae bacterium]MDD3922453.1 bifunctional UDP-3-O-[3-hydroxymyristoyl] N-acetylglucosamine deacetylase/3-hydroxyacyl-ACP dehydratase [Endomicrobiaceae bacterium]
MSKQTTIEKEIIIEGVGLHTGNKSKMIFKPASANSGIHFIRVDLPNKPDIKADWNSLSTGTAIRGTTIEKGDVKVHTIEHILATCSALGVDNLIIEIDNSEPPITDGSAKLISQQIMAAGIKDLDAVKESYVIKEPISFSDGKTKITAYPSDKFEIDCTIGFEHPFLSHQQASFVITRDTFLTDISPARTFCFDYEIEALQSNGLARGGSLENAIVIGPNEIYNKEPLRYENEFVRHKILDLIGDLALAGKSIKAKIVAEKPGHKSNVSFVKEFVNKAILEKDGKILEESVDTQEQNKEERIINSAEIQKIIPHRYPILMIDRVKLTSDPIRAVGYKCVSGNEPFFQGHFPGKPIMPGVLIVEAMAQTSCVLFLSRPEMKNCLAYFMAIDNVKFRKTVIPGDVLEMKIEVIRDSGRKGKVKGEAYVDGKLATEAEFMFIIVDKEA